MNTPIIPARENKTALRILPPLVLVLASIFFAFYKSNSAFTSDEVWSIRVASLDFQAEMEALKADVHPPLYYQSLYGWIRLFGTGERMVRALSGLLYLFSVFALYGLARDLYGEIVALLASTVYAASPLAILSAQFARMYSLLSLLAILSTWLYLQFSARPCKSNLKFTAYVLVNVLGTFTHIAFFFVIFGQIAYHLIFHRRAQLMRLSVALTLSLIPYALIWAPVLVRQFSKSQEGLAWVNKPSFSTYVELFVVYGGAFWLLLPIVIYLRWRKRSEVVGWYKAPHLRRFPIWLLGITIATPLLLSQIKPIFNSRLAIVGLHLFALSAAAILGNSKINYFLSLEIVLLTFIGLIVLHPGFSSCDNRATASFLNSATANGDAIIFTSLTRFPIDYYLDRIPGRKDLLETSFPSEIDQHPGYEGSTTDPRRRGELENEARDLAERLERTLAQEGDHQVFVLRGFHPVIDAMLDQKLRDRLDFKGVVLRCDEASPYFKEIVVYKKVPAQ